MMATTNLNFSAQIDSWVQTTELRMTAVFRESTQRVVSEAQANLTPHVDTGFLRASIRGSTASMPLIEPAKEGKAEAGSGGEISSVIANAKLGETIYAGWTAFYGPFVEYGTAPHDIYPKDKTVLHWVQNGKSMFATHVHHPGTRPVAFVRRAAEGWSRIVSEVTQEAKTRAGR